jgi:streptogramin lyase
MNRRNQTLLGGVIGGRGIGVTLASSRAAPATEVGELKVTIHEWSVPTKGAPPHDPAVGPDGALWFTEQMANKLGRLDPTTGAVKMWVSPAGHDSGPYGIAISTDRMVWYSESGVKPNTIIQFNPKTGNFARAIIPPVGAWCATWRQRPTGGCILLVAAWAKLVSWNAPAEYPFPAALSFVPWRMR